MILHPLHLTNPDWQAYNTLCLKMFSESPIRRLDAAGQKMTTSTFLGSLLPVGQDEAIAQSIKTGTAKHIYLGFMATEYQDSDILSMTACANIAIKEVDPGLMLLSGTLKDWYDVAVCLINKRSDVSGVVYIHLKRAGFEAIFHGYEYDGKTLKAKR
jgi:hypothetical protein